MIKKLNGLCQIFLKSFAYFLFMIETFEAACIIFGRSPRKVDGPNPGEKYDDYWPEAVSLLNDTHFIKTVQNFKPESLDKNTIEMRVWERGSRETFACGTGACAAVVSAVENGFFHKNQDIEVRLRGGNLIVKYEEDRVYMTGPAEEVFKGEVDI